MAAKNHLIGLVEEIRGDDRMLASYLRIEERELEAGGLTAMQEKARKAGLLRRTGAPTRTATSLRSGVLDA